MQVKGREKLAGVDSVMVQEERRLVAGTERRLKCSVGKGEEDVVAGVEKGVRTRV